MITELYWKYLNLNYNLKDENETISNIYSFKLYIRKYLPSFKKTELYDPDKKLFYDMLILILTTNTNNNNNNKNNNNNNSNKKNFNQKFLRYYLILHFTARHLT